VNYNGQLTGNLGIHSRYETILVNQHLQELPLPDSSGIYWQNVIDSVFQYIEDLYPYGDSIIAADDLAFSQDSLYGSVYYDVLWSELDSITIIAIHSAIIDLASTWYTAWIDAGEPIPPAISVTLPNLSQIDDYLLSDNYPNPFNPATTIQYALPETGDVLLTIYDLRGQEVASLVSEVHQAGYHKATWDASNFSSGIYFYRLQAGNFVQTRKMVLLK